MHILLYDCLCLQVKNQVIVWHCWMLFVLQKRPLPGTPVLSFECGFQNKLAAVGFAESRCWFNFRQLKPRAWLRGVYPPSLSVCVVWPHFCPGIVYLKWIFGHQFLRFWQGFFRTNLCGMWAALKMNRTVLVWCTAAQCGLFFIYLVIPGLRKQTWFLHQHLSLLNCLCWEYL